jgi:orotate phosphoribosyltransferase
VVDREQGGAAILEQQGYPVDALYSASHIIEYFLTTGRITAEESLAATEFLKRKQYS